MKATVGIYLVLQNDCGVVYNVSMSSKRFYCYVDETGQDSKGNIFIVTVVIPENRDEVLEYLERIEKQRGLELTKPPITRGNSLSLYQTVWGSSPVRLVFGCSLD